MDVNMFIDGIKVTVKSGEDEGFITTDEIQLYVDYANEQISKIKEAQSLTEVNIEIENGEVTIEYKYSTVKFERIRRITGNHL